MLATAAALLAAAGYLWQPAPEPVPESPKPAHSTDSATFGPGAWIEPGPNPPASVNPSEYEPVPQGLAVTANQQLLVNPALHDIIDSFLLGGHPGDRATHASALRAHLKSKLPAAAYDDAALIVQHYLAYMDAHDELLARQVSIKPQTGDAAQDMERISGWLAQRERLRQTLLGINLTKAWYGDEDAQLRHILAETGQRSVNATSDAEPAEQDSNTLRARRLQSGAQEAQRERTLQEFTQRAVKSFAMLEREAQSARQETEHPTGAMKE